MGCTTWKTGEILCAPNASKRTEGFSEAILNLQLVPGNTSFAAANHGYAEISKLRLQS